MQNNLCILCPFSSAFSCLFNVNFAHFNKSKCFLKIIAYWDFYINDIKAWMVMGKAYHMTWFKYPHLKNSETPICNCYHRSPVPVSRGDKIAWHLVTDGDSLVCTGAGCNTSPLLILMMTHRPQLPSPAVRVLHCDPLTTDNTPVS